MQKNQRFFDPLATQNRNDKQPGKRDSEVVPRAKRRTFTRDYKLRIVQEADQCKTPGEIGALLRREGLYSSSLNPWRSQRDAGKLGTRKRGRKADPSTKEVTRLRRENERLRKKLQKAATIIEFQKKLSDLLGDMPEEKSGRK